MTEKDSNKLEPAPALTPVSTRLPVELFLFLYGFAVAFWLWAKWLFSPQMFFLPPLPPVEVLISLVERVLGVTLVALITLSSLALIAVDALRFRRARHLDLWGKSLLRGAVETVLIHVAVWIVGSVVFFVLLAVMPGSDIKGRGTADPVVRGLALFSAFLSLIVAGPITGIIMCGRCFARQRHNGSPPTPLETLNHTVTVLLVPLLLLWIASGYPGQTLHAIQQSAGAKTKNTGAALVGAARQGETETVRALIRQGAQVNARDPSGATSVMVAAANGHIEIVQVLILAGAAVKARNDVGRTALMTAAANRYPDIVRALLQAGAGVNAKDNDGKTALMLSAAVGQEEITQGLIQAGADVNAKSLAGDTALITAARGGQTGIVHLLLKAGADVNARNKNGDSALRMASKLNHAETARALRDAGANDSKLFQNPL